VIILYNFRKHFFAFFSRSIDSFASYSLYSILRDACFFKFGRFECSSPSYILSVLLKVMKCFPIYFSSSAIEIDPLPSSSIWSKKNSISSLLISGCICLINSVNWLKDSSGLFLNPKLYNSFFRLILLEFMLILNSVITIFSLSSNFWFYSAYLWN